MNESSPHEPHQQGAQAPSGFFPWLRSLGIVRDPNNRWFAGVASGIARRARIDPLVIRAVFVVLAILGGPGILLYLIGWLFLPDVSGKIHVEELVRGRSTPGVTIVAVVLAVSCLIGLLGGFSPLLRWDVWGFIGLPQWISVTVTVLFWIAFVAVAIVVAQRLVVKHGKERAQAQRTAAPDSTSDSAPGSAPSPGEQPEPSAAPSFEESMRDLGNNFSAQAEEFSHKVSAQAEEFGQKVSSKASAWGQSVADTTGEWSTQYAEHYEKTRMPTGQKIITLALTLLAAGGALLWAATSDAMPEPPLPWEGSGALLLATIAATAVLAVSIIIAGVRGKHTGGIGFLGFLGVVAMLLIAVLPWGSRYFFIGSHTSGTENHSVIGAIGSTHIDLTDLDATRLRDEYTVTQAIGNVTVDLPRTKPVELTVKVGAGKITETQQLGSEGSREVTRDSGLFSHRTFLVNGDAPGKPIPVQIIVGAGEAIVIPSPDSRTPNSMEITR